MPNCQTATSLGLRLGEKRAKEVMCSTTAATISSSGSTPRVERCTRREPMHFSEATCAKGAVGVKFLRKWGQRDNNREPIHFNDVTIPILSHFYPCPHAPSLSLPPPSQPLSHGLASLALNPPSPVSSSDHLPVDLSCPLPRTVDPPEPCSTAPQTYSPASPGTPAALHPLPAAAH